MTPVGLELSQYINNDELMYGDILLKVNDGSPLSGLISFGQRLFQAASNAKPNTQIVHAGIMLDGETIIESQSEGVVRNNLRTQNLNYDYEVYRCLLTNVAEMAASVASLVLNQHTAQKNAKYSFVGAARSVFGGHGGANPSGLQTVLQQLSNGKGKRFFCSQFVVCCYQYAANHHNLSMQQFFPLNSTAYSPYQLKQDISQSQFFYRAGVLRRGIRL